MTITIVTVYRGYSAETYVGAVQGTLSDEQKDALKKAYNINEDEGDEDMDTIGFRESIVADDPKSLHEIRNAFGVYRDINLQNKT